MLCEKSQFKLAIGTKNLAPEELDKLENHLQSCVSCRQKSVQYSQISNDLKILSRPVFSPDKIKSLQCVVAVELKNSSSESNKYFSPEMYEWLQMRVMPYAFGVAGALLLGVSLIWFLLNNNVRNLEFARLDTSKSATVLLNTSNYTAETGDTKLAISGESPTINPTGALLSMTKQLVSGQAAGDKEIVVVADVFSNGLARIAEVVEPRSDARKMSELNKALQSDPDFAPFLPAQIDRRAETVRVIFKIQRVDVIEPTAKRKR